MAISEARRRDLYDSLDELLGTELAEARRLPTGTCSDPETVFL